MNFKEISLHKLLLTFFSLMCHCLLLLNSNWSSFVNG